MCNADVYLIKNGVESIIMESVDIMRLDDDGVYVENIKYYWRTP